MSVSPANPLTGNESRSAPAIGPESAKLLLAPVIVLATALVVAVHVQTILGNPQADAAPGNALMSQGLRKHFASRLPSESPLAWLIPRTAAVAVCVWLFGGTVVSVVSRAAWRTTLWRWSLRFLWPASLALFEVLWGIGGLLHRNAAGMWLSRTADSLLFFHTIAVGGFLAGGLGLLLPPERSRRLQPALAHPAVVWLAAAIYAATFTTLSVFQYRALMVPHGDTAMYEEHLWNLLHGKGFRSQLDGGRLFFGEHLEVIHLLLLPVYALFPCLPTLNVCLSLGLASGAVAVRGITRKLTDSPGAANWLGVAYLLYFPLQYLNLEASLKTFRPENLGVPLLLFAIWCLETNRLRTMLLLLGLTLLAKEDYAIPVGMLGLFLVLRPGVASPGHGRRRLGAGVMLFAAAYLWYVLSVFIPHFRDGAPPHYMVYYEGLGGTPAEIVANLVRQPSLLLQRLFAGKAGFGNLVLICMLVLSLGGLPLAGFGRLCLLVPSLLSILLIKWDDARTPFFHFHAPLVPVIFWAAAEGIRRFSIFDVRYSIGVPTATPGSNVRSATCDPKSEISPAQSGIENRKSKIENQKSRIACFVAMCALVSGFWSGKSPLSASFYDPDADVRGFGLALYARAPRVRRFHDVFSLIPRDASVAATDFVRPRFTHHRACHQYGAGGLKPHVPAESIDYIVIDLQGPYSNWLEGRRLREVEEQPDQWERVYDDVFYFYVVRAKRAANRESHVYTNERPR